MGERSFGASPQRVSRRRPTAHEPILGFCFQAEPSRIRRIWGPRRLMATRPLPTGSKRLESAQGAAPVMRVGGSVPGSDGGGTCELAARFKRIQAEGAV